MPDPIALLSATDALDRLRDNRLTAGELVEAMLTKISGREPTIQAFQWRTAPDALRAAARDVDAARRAGTALPPLAGLAIGVKDVLDTADLPSQYGSAIWAGHRPRADAAVVAALRGAGALVFGKTVTTEFATRHPGPTTNPHDPAHTPGGSSSGSAAGVAAGFFHAGLATQTAGSIIRPAAYCGAVGFKPSFGTLHRGGMKVMSESLDTIGVIARSVRDCALFVDVAAGRRPAPLATLGHAPRLGVTLGPDPVTATPAARAALEKLAADAAANGARVEPFTLPAVLGEALARHPIVMNAESAGALGWERAHAAAQLTPGLRERLAWGAAQDPATLAAARESFVAARAAFAAAMGPYDALLTLPAPGEAPAGLGWTGDPVFNALWTLLHVPCITLPTAKGPGGLPLGVQVVGRQGEDAGLLGCAAWLARLTAS